MIRMPSGREVPLAGLTWKEWSRIVREEEAWNPSRSSTRVASGYGDRIQGAAAPSGVGAELMAEPISFTQAFLRSLPQWNLIRRVAPRPGPPAEPTPSAANLPTPATADLPTPAVTDSGVSAVTMSTPVPMQPTMSPLSPTASGFQFTPDMLKSILALQPRFGMAGGGGGGGLYGNLGYGGNTGGFDPSMWSTLLNR